MVDTNISTSANRSIVTAVSYFWMLCAVVGCTQQSEELTTGNTQQEIVEPLDLLNLTASEISPKLQSGEVSVLEYMEALLQQTELHSDRLRAFITHDPDHVLAAAIAADQKRERGAELGPLFGIPISLKDLIVTKDMPTTFGTSIFENFMASKNAPAVDRLLAADAIIFGKNNAQEWAYGSNGYNSHYGQQLNPYDKNRIAGGSSGGGVAAVAARMLPIAIGSDTAASIRVPAAYTGLFGLRPSTGRYDNSGVAPLAPTLDTIGPLTRSVDDLALIDSVLSDDFNELAAIELSSLRLGVPSEFFYDGTSSELKSAFDTYLDSLRNAGVTLVAVDLQDAAALNDAALYPILFYETHPSIVEFLASWGDGTSFEELYAEIGWDVKAIWDQLVIDGAPDAIPEEVYRNAIDVARPELQANYDAYFSDNQLSAMIFPATASAAPFALPDNPQESIIDDEAVSIFINDHNSSPGALAGQPGVVFPIALNSIGLPLAVSLDGKRNEDRELLAIAKSLSALIPTIPAPSLRNQ